MGPELIGALLDTSCVIATSLKVALPNRCAISAATLAELHFGVLVTTSPKERALRLRRLTEIESRLHAIPVDDAVARSYGLLAETVVRNGRQPRRRVMDLLIAATAHAHSLVLYTSNVADFAGLDEHISIVDA